MASFACDFELPPFQLEQLAGHLQRTLDLWYDGPSHRGQMANYFRISADECYDPAPAPVAFRGIVAQVRDGGHVRVARLDAPDAAVVSTMLIQTSVRLNSDGPSGRVLAEALTGTRLDFDKEFRVPRDEQKRLAKIGEAARAREKQRAAERKAADDLAERDRSRAAIWTSYDDGENERDGFAAVASGGADSLPASVRGRSA